MRVGAFLVLFAVGAILKFAVTDSVKHVDLGVVGVVLMIVAAAGILFEVIVWATRRRSDVIVHEPVYRETYRNGPTEPPVERY